jgi:hypothetical protein
MTMDELLEEACYYEGLAHACGLGDPAFHYFIIQRNACFNEALALEKSS